MFKTLVSRNIYIVKPKILVEYLIRGDKMINKKFAASIVAASLMMGAVAVPAVGAANLGDKIFVSKTAPISEQKTDKPMHRNISMSLLAEITGKSAGNLEAQYPQKTAWQIAKSLGKLDDLKKAYLEHTKKAIDGLVADKKVSKEDGDKMYADVEKRVSAIDGVNIVIPGKPNFNPKLEG